MYYKILLVDDDENVLQAFYRNLRNHYSIQTALGPKAALEALENNGPFAVLISDMHMPEMSGLELLKIVKKRWPDTIRIMLTVLSDQATAVDAVNQGEVYRFLSKPCAPEHMQAAIQSGLRQFFLVQAEKMLLERTLTGSIRVLTDLLSLMDPDAYRLSRQIQDRARLVGKSMGLEKTWELEAAAMLMPAGQAVLPRPLVQKLKEGLALNTTEKALADRVPEFGAMLVEKIPRMEEVAAILRYQDTRTDAARKTEKQRLSQEIQRAADILKIVFEFAHREKKGQDPREILKELESLQEQDLEILTHYEKQIIDAKTRPAVERPLDVTHLSEGMILARDVADQAGEVILQKGLHLGQPHIHLLKSFYELQDLQQPVYVVET